MHPFFSLFSFSYATASTIARKETSVANAILIISTSGRTIAEKTGPTARMMQRLCIICHSGTRHKKHRKTKN